MIKHSVFRAKGNRFNLCCAPSSRRARCSSAPHFDLFDSPFRIPYQKTKPPRRVVLFFGGAEGNRFNQGVDSVQQKSSNSPPDCCIEFVRFPSSNTLPKNKTTPQGGFIIWWSRVRQKQTRHYSLSDLTIHRQ